MCVCVTKRERERKKKNHKEILFSPLKLFILRTHDPYGKIEKMGEMLYIFRCLAEKGFSKCCKIWST